MTSLEGLEPKWTELLSKSYGLQARWWLNAFWEQGAERLAESVWITTRNFIDLDAALKARGTGLDEFAARRLFESEGTSHDAVRGFLASQGIQRTKTLSLSAYLLFKFPQFTVKVCFLFPPPSAICK